MAKDQYRNTISRLLEQRGQGAGKEWGNLMGKISFTTVQENGFEGILYPGNGSRQKAVIVVSGSNGCLLYTSDAADE